LCDGVNNDCNNGIWPSLSSNPFGLVELDLDQDGYMVCAGDCNDANPAVHPGAPELCNGIDDDCDGSMVGEADADHDGVRICAGDCDDTRADVYPGHSERCDGIDNNCNGVVDEGGDALCTFNDGCYLGTCMGAEGCTDVTRLEGTPCDYQGGSFPCIQ